MTRPDKTGRIKNMVLLLEYCFIFEITVNIYSGAKEKCILLCLCLMRRARYNKKAIEKVLI